MSTHPSSSTSGPSKPTSTSSATSPHPASAPSTATHSLAILDDYQHLAPPLFPSTPNLTISSYPQTLSPHNPSHLPTLLSRLKTHSIISTMRERTSFPASLLRELPNLQLLLTTGMYNASIDLAAARELGIVVAGTDGKGRTDGRDAPGEKKKKTEAFDATAQHTWSLILALSSRVGVDSAGLQGQLRDPLPGAEVERHGAWQSGFATLLAGRTLGVVGLGRLGAQAARTASLGFGMEVLCWSESLTQEKADYRAREVGVEAGRWRAVEMEEVFRSADVVSLHCVLSERSKGIVGARELGWMKKSALLVNTARGALVDEDALYEALIEGRIAGAGLDVFWQEPLEEGSRWRTTKWGREGKADVVLSPHMGYVQRDNLEGWYAEQAENVERWLRGEEVVKRMN